MGFNPESYAGSAAGQRTEAGPTVDFGVATAYAVNTGSYVYIKQKTTATGAPGGDNWACGANSYLSWNLWVTHPMTLEIDLMAATDFPTYGLVHWRAFPLFPDAMNCEGPFYVPAWAFRLEVRNNSGTNGVLTGMVKVQGLA